MIPSGSLTPLYNPTGVDGTHYWGGQDLDVSFGSTSDREININGVDTSMFTNLTVTIALSAGTSADIESSDFIEIFIEGASVDKFTGSDDSGSKTLMSNGTTTLTTSFIDFTYNTADVDFLDIQIKALNSTPNEAFAIDNIRINGDPIPEPATLALMGLGLAGIGYQRRRKQVS